MEATVLKKNKTNINKGKIKKTLKNVICRPDSINWPLISEDEGKELELILRKYRVEIPEFKKPHWKDIKDLPKNQRPRRPTPKKVEGLVFGLSECRSLVDSNEVSALILDGEINPKAIVQPLIEVCRNKQVPILCMTGLRKISTANFGITTSCLGVKTDCLTSLVNKIVQISKLHKSKHIIKTHDPKDSENMEVEHNVNDIDMKNSAMSEKFVPSVLTPVQCYTYLYRTNKKRVFVPPDIDKPTETTNKFVGQDFIEFSNNTDKVKGNKAYKNMVVKRISNNPNRVKVKKCKKKNRL
ncbi:uncharacterized protein [Battus philenor]|uniref:uncharacterized protein n=1 Tax=Battus philenor TaxID=42288 RepID=UPI0035D13954